jgi:hypothetical protein
MTISFEHLTFWSITGYIVLALFALLFARVIFSAIIGFIAVAVGAVVYAICFSIDLITQRKFTRPNLRKFR